MFCPKCGNQLNDGAVFCPKCGLKVDGGSSDTGSQGDAGRTSGTVVTDTTPATNSGGKAKKGMPKGLKIGLIAAALLVVVGIIAFVASNSGSSAASMPSRSATPAADTSSGAGSTAPEAEPASTQPAANDSADETEDTESPSAGNGFTVMVYMVGADLESGGGMATEDLIEMSAASFGDDVNLIVQTGGSKQWQNDIVDADKLQRYQIKDGKLVNRQDLPLESMLSVPALSDFISWSAENYPAARYGLILWDHGGGLLGGYGHDEHYPDDGLSIPDVTRAIKDSGVHFEFVGYDACLMGCFEAAYALKDCADYLIASEESESAIGWYYTDWLTFLGEDSSRPMEEIGRAIIDGMVNVNQEEEKTATLSLIDLDKIDDVYNAWTDYMDMAMEDLEKGNFAEQSKAIENVRKYGYNSDKGSGSDMVDMLDFINQTALPGSHDLQQTIRSCVIYSNSNIVGSNGISVYFPYLIPKKYSYATDLMKEIGLPDSYKNYFDSFYSILSRHKEDIQSDEAESASTANEPEVTIPKWLEFKEGDNGLFIKFTDEQIDAISNIAIESGIVYDDVIRSTGETVQRKSITEDGYLIANWNGRMSCLYFMLFPWYPYNFVYDSGTYTDGTWYETKLVPAVLSTENNDFSKDIYIVINYTFRSEDDYDVDVPGYLTDDGSDMPYRTLYEFSEGHTVMPKSRYYYRGKDSDEGFENSDFEEKYSVVIPVVNGKLIAGYETLDDSDIENEEYCFRYVITDIYQNKHYTEWLFLY